MKRAIVILGICFTWLSAKADSIVISVNIRDCVACRAVLYDTAELAKRFTRITIAFPSRFRRDSSKLVATIPAIAYSSYRITWDDAIIPEERRSAVSTVYRFDDDNHLIQSIPLHLFNPADFPARRTRQNGTIDRIEVVSTKNAMPSSLANMHVAGNRLLLVDNISSEIVYFDFADSSKSWKSISVGELVPTAFSRFFDTPLNDALKIIARTDSALRTERLGGLFSVSSLTSNGDTTLLVLSCRYTTESSLYTFHSMCELIGERVLRVLPIIDSNNAVNALVEAELNKMSKEVSYKNGGEELRAMKARVAPAVAMYKHKHPNWYSVVALPDIYKTADGKYVMNVVRNEPTYRFLGLYREHSGMLVPADSMLPLERGEIFKKSAVKRGFYSLTGRYPYVMHRISNTLYDIERISECPLPLPLNTYDISASALAQMKMKIGLFVYDVISDEGTIKVLYASNNDQKLKLLVYDGVTRSTVLDTGLHTGNKPILVKDNTHLKFFDVNSFLVVDEESGVMSKVYLN